MINKKSGKATASQPNADISKIDFTKLRPINKNIVFVWVDEIETEFTHNGIIIERTLDRNRARWGKVVASADSTVPVGNYILPESVSEPYGAVFGGIEVWRTKLDNIQAMSPNITDTYQVNGDWT